MKKALFKRKRLLSFLMAILLFSVYMTFPSSSLNEDIPSIYIGNSAWYKYRLYPPIVEESEIYIPCSVFESVDGIAYEYSEDHKCILLSSEEGNYISISIDSEKALFPDGKTENMRVIKLRDEYYLNAKKVCESLGLEYATGTFYETEVIRILDSKSNISLETLVSINKVSSSGIGSSSQENTDALKSSDSAGIVVDLTNTEYYNRQEALNVISGIRISATYIIDSEFISDSANMEFLLKINATGGNFAIMANKGQANQVLQEIEECNRLLDRMLKQKTRLYYGTPSNTLTKAGYVCVNCNVNINNTNENTLSVSDILLVNNITPTVLIDLRNLILKTSSAGVMTAAVSRTTGD